MKTPAPVPPAVPAEDAETQALIDQLARLSADARRRVLEELHRRMQAAIKPDGSADDRRHLHRAKVLRSGKIIWNGRSSVMDCQIRDLSAGGCRLRVASTLPLPSHFDLRLMGEPGERLCEVRWRSPQEIGVRFLA